MDLFTPDLVGYVLKLSFFSMEYFIIPFCSFYAHYSEKRWALLPVSQANEETATLS